MLSSIQCCLWKPISTKYAVLDFIICITSKDKKIPVTRLSSNSYPCVCHKSAELLQQSHAWPPTVSNFKLLQRVQNAVARIALDLSKFCHITPALQQLHWLPVIKQIQFKILLLTFKAIHGLSPPYISELMTVKAKSTYGLHSNNSTLLLPTTQKMLPTLSACSFAAVAAALWNKLPADIRNVASLNSFKKPIKTFLFNESL